MTNFIPIFPLGIVVFPEEQVNLHIFEPRYKQLIQDCYGENRGFGIPAVVGDKMQEHGTLVAITEIKEVYADGKMDIRVKGQQVFRLLEVIKTIPDKLYAGAIVNYIPADKQVFRNQMPLLMEQIYQLHKLLKIEKTFKPAGDELVSYDVAHHAGLTTEQELELLTLPREDQRQEYLKRHLKALISVINEMETLKERVKLNGHFRELKSFGL